MNSLDRSLDTVIPIDLFHGDANPNVARLYARVRDTEPGEGWSVQGTVRGPFVAGRRTLPMTVSFREVGPGATLLLQAVLPDPVCWSPEQPAWYVAELTLARAGDVISTTSQSVVIRRLGDNGTRFRWDDQLWQLTADECSIDELDLTSSQFTPVVRSLTPAIAERAVRAGQPLVAWLVDSLASDWQTTVRFPAVTFAVLASGDERGEWLLQHAPNVIRIEQQAVTDFCSSTPIRPRSSWAQAVALRSSELRSSELLSAAVSPDSSGMTSPVRAARVPVVVLLESHQQLDRKALTQLRWTLPTAGWIRLAGDRTGNDQ